jgi:hypothetical protein
MADKTKSTAPVETSPQVDPNTTDKWIEIHDHRPMYMPKDSGMKTIRGYMLGTKEMNPSNKNVKENVPIEDQYWIAIVFLSTVATTLRSPEGDFREYPAGTQCLVGGADLASLYQRADDLVRCYEVEIKPGKELALGGGRRMMLFSKRVNPTSVLRKGSGGAFEFLEGRAYEKLLEAQTTAAAEGNGAGGARAALPPANPDSAEFP